MKRMLAVASMATKRKSLPISASSSASSTPQSTCGTNNEKSLRTSAATAARRKSSSARSSARRWAAASRGEGSQKLRRAGVATAAGVGTGTGKGAPPRGTDEWAAVSQQQNPKMKGGETNVRLSSDGEQQDPLHKRHASSSHSSAQTSTPISRARTMRNSGKPAHLDDTVGRLKSTPSLIQK